jgi:BatD DUF11 like domain
VVSDMRCKGLIRHLVIALLMLVPPGAAAEISVQTDHDPVALSESFQIIFQADGSADGDPDFSPLNKDFKVLGTSQSSNFSMVNGDITQSKTWTLNVLARRTGRLMIPPISFGNEQSPARAITVQDSVVSNGTGDTGDDIILEADAGPEDPYVQSQVIYRLRLFRSVPTANATLSEPEVDGGKAVIEKLGDDANYETRLHGKRFAVVERKYAIYPQTSGDVTIKPVTFQGQVQDSARSMFRFDPFGSVDPFGSIDPFGSQPRTVVRQTKPVRLSVKPVPAAFKGTHWLPARSLNVTELWSQDPPEFRVGDPITRTVTITADGLTGGQLPELPHWVPADFKSYPDHPLLNDSKTDNSIVGARQEKTALIPEHPGEAILPRMEIPWWNTATDRMEVAVLPERRIKVLPATGAVNITPPSVTPAPAAESSQPAAKQSVPETAASDIQTGTVTRWPWHWISLGLALAWLITLALWYGARARTPRAAGANGNGNERPMRELARHLKRACAAHDPEAVKTVLLQWGAQRWKTNPPKSLGDISDRSGAAFARELRRLGEALYGRSNASWDGEPLWRAFEAETPQEKTAPQNTGGLLQPLHRL